jgi:hypothetical protein
VDKNAARVGVNIYLAFLLALRDEFVCSDVIRVFYLDCEDWLTSALIEGAWSYHQEPRRLRSSAILWVTPNESYCVEFLVDLIVLCHLISTAHAVVVYEAPAARTLGDVTGEILSTISAAKTRAFRRRSICAAS